MAQDIQKYFEAFQQIADLEETSSDDAITLSRQVAKEARDNGDVGFALFFEGEAFCLEGDLKQGEKLLAEAVEKAPAADFLFANYGVVLSILGRVRESIAMLDRALQLNDKNVTALGQKGVCLSKLMMDDLALQCFDRVLDIEPENTHAIRNKGVSLSRLRREEEALTYLDNALAINPNDQHALSEKQILLDEIRLKGTPLGWLMLWLRKVVTPALKRLFHKGY